MRLTIVIPVHQAEAYLEECLGSVGAQAGVEKQVVAVENGSTDGSLAILRNYRARHGWPELVEAGAIGVAAARNLGLERADGEYVAFLDSDDVLPSGAYARMLDEAREHDADIVTGVARSFRGRRRWLNPQMQEVAFNVGGPVALNDVPALGRDASPCNKIFRRALIEREELRFPEGIEVREDLHFAIRAYAAAARICVIPDIVYHYRLRPADAEPSLTQLKTAKVIRDLLWVLTDLEARPLGLSDDVKSVLRRGLVANIAYRLPSAALELDRSAAVDLLEQVRERLAPLGDAPFDALSVPRQAFGMALVRAKAPELALDYWDRGLEAGLVDDLERSGRLQDGEVRRRLFDLAVALSSGEGGRTSVRRSTGSGALRSKAKDLEQVVRRTAKRRARDAKLATARVSVGRDGAPGRRVWVVGERRGTSAEDTGFTFFDYLRRERPDIDAYFVSQPDVLSHLSDRSRTLAYGSYAAVRALLSAEAIVFSDSAMDVYRHWRRLVPHLRPICAQVFLQHGVIGTSAMRGFYHRPVMAARAETPDVFVTSSPRERELVVQRMGHPEEVVVTTGLPRFDAMRLDAETERQILVMPTWRYWLRNAAPVVLRRSRYFLAWRQLLRDPALLELLEAYDYRAVFCPHFTMRGALATLEVESERVRLMRADDEGVGELVATSRLLVTDYSSVGFDFAYLRKAVLYYPFDRLDFAVGNGTLGLDFEEELPGPVVEEHSGLLRELEAHLTRGGRPSVEHASRADRFFASRDRANCPRIVEAIDAAIARKRHAIS